ncbi:MAG: pantetheine-phosphate adenylyltransferase [Bacteroidales bacterium]|jgi:pantetheine-phosphate adenylyltransferase
MNKIAVFPGSFDPITKGHESIVRRALPIFDKIIIAIGINSEKTFYFTPEQREVHMKQVFRGENKIVVDKYSGLTVEYCKKVNAKYILRGLRISADFEFERGIAHLNKAMYPEIETVFLLAEQEYSALNSTIVREILRNGGDVSLFVPEKLKL